MVYALTLSYRGTDYAGWQRQTNAVAVQQVVEEGLEGVLGHEVKIHGAGRTDAGVHARGQVAHFESDRDFPARGLVHATNRLLPPDIRILGAERMADGFHARKHARSKQYRYRLIETQILSPLDAPFAVRVGALDLGAMREATALLVGRHDFTAFALAGGSHTNPVRRIFDAGWREEGERRTLIVTGDGFLRGMVRGLVGTLIEVGEGRRTVQDVASLLVGLPRSEAGPTAPAQGLVLQKVDYGERWRRLAVQ